MLFVDFLFCCFDLFSSILIESVHELHDLESDKCSINHNAKNSFFVVTDSLSEPKVQFNIVMCISIFRK